MSNYNSIAFRGCFLSTGLRDETGVEKGFCHESRFFRDLPVLNFNQKYLRENFPNGTKIADFACSYGQETHTMAMLLSDVNQTKKYKVCGVDIIPRAVDLARQGLFVVENNQYEAILFPPKKRTELVPHILFLGNGLFVNGMVEKESAQKELSSKEHFAIPFFTKKEVEQKELLQELGITEEEGQYASKLFREHFTTPVLTKKETSKLLRVLFSEIRRPQEFFVAKANHGKFEGVIDFQVGDIRKAHEVLNGEKPGLVMFHNAIYHITDARTGDNRIANIAPIREVFDEVHRLLPEKGIFSIGNLARDHVVSNSYNLAAETIKQNGQSILVARHTPLHEELRRAGFEPVFYSELSEFLIHVPSVWRKI